MGSLLSNRNVVAVAVLLSVVDAVNGNLIPMSGLLLVVLGLVGGFMAGPNDQTRLFLSALVLNHLGKDAIAFGETPLAVVGTFLGSFNENLAVVLGAAAVMIVYMNIKNRLMGG